MALALDIADCEDRLTVIHVDILALMDRREADGGDEPTATQ